MKETLQFMRDKGILKVMGMFDQIRNDYKPLGPEFQGVLQTKDLDNLMDWYYIDPSGKLSLVEYSGTQDFVPRECNDRVFPLVGWKPNGNHGRVMRAAVLPILW